MHLLVTGTPGSGKTSLVAYARQMTDARFVDADTVPGLCEWREFATGNAVGLVDDIGIKSEDSWHKQYGWYWVEETLKQYLTAHENAVVCGSAENVTDCYELFDMVVVLRKTQQELLHNLSSPDRTNPFGKTTQQRANFMNWQEHLIHNTKRKDLIVLEGNVISETYSKVAAMLEG